MSGKPLSNVIGFDDAPHQLGQIEPVPIVGTIFAKTQLNGVVIGQVEKDGDDAATQIIDLLQQSKFLENLQLILLQGIAFGGFNVVDVFALYEALQLPVLVVARNQPDMAAVKKALLTRIPNGSQKWHIIEQLGEMERVDSVFVQRVGIDLAQGTAVIRKLSIHGNIPEPLRTAHLIAGALVDGQSRGRT
jgi:endonuclease V-like protein UPF0215 family